MDTKDECSVCQTPTTGDHCSNCGQEIKGEIITFKSVILDFLSNVFSLERSVFASMVRLVINPHSIITNYWEGNRKYYPSPGKVFFYSLAVAAFHISFINEQEILGTTLDIEGYKSQFFFWAVFMPLLVLSSFFVYIKRESSFVKNISSQLYLASSFFTIITILMDLVNYLSPETIQFEAFLVFFILVFTWNTRVFDHGKNFWRKLVNTLLQILIFLSFLALIGLSIHLLSPENRH